MASMADLRQSLKRDLSFNSTNSLQSAMRASKRWKSEHDAARARLPNSKVSFGCVNETVLFDKKHSSSNLSMGVSVSSVSGSSFGSFMSTTSSVGNLRWGEQHTGQKQNASWTLPPVPVSHFSASQGSNDDDNNNINTGEARWSAYKPQSSSGPRNNMFFQSSATTNALKTLQHQRNSNNNSSARTNVTNSSSSSSLCRSLSTSTTTPSVISRPSPFSMQAPPRRPGRCKSPVTILPDLAVAPTTPSCPPPPIFGSSHGNNSNHSTSTRKQPPKRPGRCQSPVVLDLCNNNNISGISNMASTVTVSSSQTPRDSQVLPPKRPGRCQSPVALQAVVDVPHPQQQQQQQQHQQAQDAEQTIITKLQNPTY